MHSDDNEVPPNLIVWEGGIILRVVERDGTEKKIDLTWDTFEEMMRFIVLAVGEIPDENIRKRVEREWGKYSDESKQRREDIGSTLDRIENQRDPR